MHSLDQQWMTIVMPEPSLVGLRYLDLPVGESTIALEDYEIHDGMGLELYYY